MPNPVYPPMEPLQDVQAAVNSLYDAIKSLPSDGTANGNIAAIGGAIEQLQGLVTSWMVTGIA